jgi:mannose-6-phosphate isomerase
MTTSLYPLKFHPRFVEKMWGGRKLESVLGKAIPPGRPIGESWELYDFPPGVVDSSGQWVSSPIANGPLAGRSLHWAVQEFGTDLYGDAALSAKHGQFPILIKFLDAREDLSVQVHPDHVYAGAHPESHLKTEAWYVLQSDPGSRLLNGLKPSTTRQRFAEAIDNGGVEQLIEAIPAMEGDCFYLPSGTVHALGAGLLVAEVQTPSDTTFRVFDFNRIDPSTGKRRTLHEAQALECIDFSAPPGPKQVLTDPLACPYFHLKRIHLPLNTERAVHPGEPTVLIVLQGSVEVRCAHVPTNAVGVRGEIILIPAGLNAPILRSDADCTCLEVSVPKDASGGATG